MDYILILLAALARILPHPPNITPVAAMALFGGAYLSRRYALLYPLMVMLLSNIILSPFLGMAPLAPEALFVYASFLITGGLGLWCRSHRKTAALYLACLASSVQFYLVTNFGTWSLNTLYPKTGTGLVQCYIAALPFFRNTLIGDLFWFSLLLGAFQLSHRLVPART